MSFTSNLHVTATKADGKGLERGHDIDAFTEKYYRRKKSA